ncbi:unnamed protein product, partial [Allacma fusca]
NVGYRILRDNFELEIFTDASKSGWGAFCDGNRTSDFWSVKQTQMSINFLDITGAFYGLRLGGQNIQS